MIWAILPSAPGRARYAPGFAVKALANANRRGSPGMPVLIASQVALVAKVIGIADAAGAVANTGCILFSGLDEAGRAAIPKHVSRPDVLGFAFTMACRVKPAMARTAAASQLARAHAKPVCLSHFNAAGFAPSPSPVTRPIAIATTAGVRRVWFAISRLGRSRLANTVVQSAPKFGRTFASGSMHAARGQQDWDAFGYLTGG